MIHHGTALRVLVASCGRPWTLGRRCPLIGQRIPSPLVRVVHLAVFTCADEHTLASGVFRETQQRSGNLCDCAKLLLSKCWATNSLLDRDDARP